MTAPSNYLWKFLTATMNFSLAFTSYHKYNMKILIMLHLTLVNILFVVPSIGAKICKDHTEDCSYWRWYGVKQNHGDHGDVIKKILDDVNDASESSAATCQSSIDGDCKVGLCSLLGPEESRDTLLHVIPEDFFIPENLEHSLSIDLPVGFYRLRRAMLNYDTGFWNEQVLKNTLNYQNVKSSFWDIGSSLTNLKENIDPTDLVGAIRKTEYLMPKTKLVRANMAYETATLTAYNDHCFAIDISTDTPEVPFGKTFVAHTKIVVLNTGENSCRMICSVQAEFPNGPPLGVGWQIKKGMKAGTMEVFQKIGMTIKNCALSFGCI